MISEDPFVIAEDDVVTADFYEVERQATSTCTLVVEDGELKVQEHRWTGDLLWRILRGSIGPAWGGWPGGPDRRGGEKPARLSERDHLAADEHYGDQRATDWPVAGTTQERRADPRGRS